MEKGGWLDQLLLNVLGFLDQQWLGVAVAVVGGFGVAYLARRSPKQDWAFVREGPAAFLSGVFLVLAVAEQHALSEFWSKFFWTLGRDFILAGIGYAAGFVVATIVLRRKHAAGG